MPETAVETRTATVAVRPLRLAFLICLQMPEEELLKYLAYNASIWGGFFNCLIPTDGRSLAEDWWRVLRTHDPDKVIFCGPASPELRQQVERALQPFRLLDWRDDVSTEHFAGRDRFGSMPLVHLLRHMYETERPVSESNIRLPALVPDSLFDVCAAAQFGLPGEQLESIYAEAFGGEKTDLGQADLGEYLAGVRQFRGRLSPLDMTKSHLSTSVRDGRVCPGFNLVLVGDEARTADVCVFWNVRMTFMSKGSLLLPISTLRGSRNLEALAAWCNENVKGTTYLNLVSAQVDKRRLVRLRDRLKRALDQRFDVVDVWHAGFGIDQLRAYEVEQRTELTIEDGVFGLPTPTPSFGDGIHGNAEWVVDVDFRERVRPGRGYVPPRYPGLADILSGQPSDLALMAGRGYRTRLAHGCISSRATKSAEYVRVRLPEDEELFASLLDSRGYGSRITDKCRYTNGIINLLGHFSHADILRDPGMRELLQRMARGEAYTIHGMKQFLKPGAGVSKHQQTEQLIADLALKRIFLRGCTIHCPACDLRQWYPIRDVAETMHCAGCLSRLQPPVNAPFSFKLNELVTRGIEQGAVPLLLTIPLLLALARESLLFVPGVQVEKLGTKADIDILAACDGELILVECKDLRETHAPAVMEQTIEQLSTVVRIATDLGARMAVLSTLLEQCSAELQRGVDDIAGEYDNISICVLHKADLERGHLTKSTSPFLGPADAEREMPALLSDLLPRARRGKEGWVREPGTRRVMF